MLHMPEHEEAVMSNQTLLNGRVKRLVNSLNLGTRHHIEEAYRIAVVNGFDYALPASDRVTWRNMASFLKAEAERY